jgi:hypothetical protein
MSDAAYGAIDDAFQAEPTRELAARLPDERRSELRKFWIGRASGELTTALSFEYMLEDLKILGAPQTLVELATSAIADEHRHVDWCLRYADLLGDGDRAEAKFGGTRPLVFDGASEQDNRLLRTVFGCCFSETVAVHVLQTSHLEITLDSVRLLNQQHLAEEVRHSRLGWGLLAWSEIGPRDREMLAAFVPEMTRITREAWHATRREADPGLHELGYLSTPLVAKACDQAFAEVIYPGLEQNDVRI